MKKSDEVPYVSQILVLGEMGILDRYYRATKILIAGKTKINTLSGGERGVYDYEVQALAEIFEVSVEWLINGGKLEISSMNRKC